MIFQFIIFGLLIYGSYTDLKTYHVSNLVVLGIILATIPLISLGISNNIFWIMRNIVIIIFTILFFIFYKKKLLGSADMWVLIPMMFIFNFIELMAFLSMLVLSQIGIGIILKKKTPYFLAITLAFEIILLQVW
ncbi:MAG: prepilin peptidase [Candidatus Methanoperedens sp.]|uniref:prepilin peptidase n=1 Tax=Candidatus Methanoperedens sp. BLZ2 TaxID=2035255 RepID=UPI000BE47546|nr:prepilin peptidase [Candidatus Methanoperedens sp. BLZ2]KAB2942402.1 MAG: hypothetical protein F9K14_17280 [Candidatus Methanoperedens sp.]MBZ0176657.1 prepilin peptidase [Candidatus Methanoperedens nitroreducens]MCX9080381.1 prepilin peptidase [Candidatus Methanoperedens sp.]